ncbi:MAG: hypothetical protein ACC628_16255 [Pirellulaceae bacterium]
MSPKLRLQFTLRRLLLSTTLTAILLVALQRFGVEPTFVFACASIPAIVVVWCLLALYRSVVSASTEDPSSPQKIATVLSASEAALIVDELARNGILANVVGGYFSLVSEGSTAAWRPEQNATISRWRLLGLSEEARRYNDFRFKAHKARFNDEFGPSAWDYEKVAPM